MTSDCDDDPNNPSITGVIKGDVHRSDDDDSSAALFSPAVNHLPRVSTSPKDFNAIMPVVKGLPIKGVSPWLSAARANSSKKPAGKAASSKKTVADRLRDTEDGFLTASNEDDSGDEKHGGGSAKHGAPLRDTTLGDTHLPGYRHNFDRPNELYRSMARHFHVVGRGIVSVFFAMLRGLDTRYTSFTNEDWFNEAKTHREVLKLVTPTNAQLTNEIERRSHMIIQFYKKDKNLGKINQKNLPACPIRGAKIPASKNWNRERMDHFLSKHKLNLKDNDIEFILDTTSSMKKEIELIVKSDEEQQNSSTDVNNSNNQQKTKKSNIGRSSSLTDSTDYWLRSGWSSMGVSC